MTHAIEEFDGLDPHGSARRLVMWGGPAYPFCLGDVGLDRVRVSYERLKIHASQPDARVYGLHTGFGVNVDSARDPNDWRKTQLDLLGYLHVGVGAPLAMAVVRRALRLQAWKVACGLSGVHPETYQALVALTGQTQLPMVPSYGSLGASGDLIPMAHAVAPLFTEGPRGPRDVIALVNTNAMMSSLALECLAEVRSQWNLAVCVTAAASVALGVNEEPFDPAVLSRNRLQAQISVAGDQVLQTRSRLLNGLGVATVPECVPVQERYSIRCSPQILGNLLENIDFSTRRIVAEALSVADNPLVLENRIWHGGLFYAAGIATACDLMADAIARMAEMVDRQVLLLVGADTNHGLPENLSSHGDLHVKGLHQLISSLNQGLRAGAVPTRNLSFSCEGNNQDVVPSSMVALVHLRSALDLSRQALRAAGFCADRAVHLRYKLPLPESLKLAAWSGYNPEYVA